MEIHAHLRRRSTTEYTFRIHRGRCPRLISVAPPEQIGYAPGRAAELPSPPLSATLGIPMNKQFYITTAIDYVNGQPHPGHVCEKIVTDVTARCLWGLI